MLSLTSLKAFRRLRVCVLKKKVSLENCPWKPPTIRISVEFTSQTPQPYLAERSA
jgi:hypothetical protein